jgi:hypothetical protein
MMQHRIYLTTLVIGLGVAACGGPPEIDRASVERVVTALSADDMMGRRAFTPGIEKAAAFIQQEFDAIGLEPLDGLEDFQQPFQVYTLTPRRQRVMLNGQTIPRSRVFVSVNQPVLSWSSEQGGEVITVGPEDDLRGVVASLGGVTTRALVLVNPSHKEHFDQYRRGSSGTRRAMELGEGGTAVFVLTTETEAETFSVEVENKVEELGLGNVVGRITGRRSDEYVLFSAHYDHLGIRPVVEGDSIANGANDDASGTTAVIELARYFKALGQPERTLLFAAFTAEEVGGYGSRYFSQQLNPDQIVAMFNIEMIGKPAAEGPNTAWITGFDRSDFGAILQRAVEGTPYSFYPDPYPGQNLFFRSDNATLARLGVPAHSISTTPIDVDTDYHQVTDHVETLDLDHMTNTIEAIARGAVTIISGRATPTRVAAIE